MVRCVVCCMPRHAALWGKKSRCAAWVAQEGSWMIRRLLCVLLLCGLATTAMPGRASATPPRPSSISYLFAHGKVLYPRGVHLDMTIHTEDPFTPSNNGEYHVVFDARMIEYVLAAGAGSAEIEAALTKVTTLVNGATVLNAVPPTFDPHTQKQNVYVLYISPYGICRCSGLPPLIYSVAGNVPHHIYLGDLFTYLHPYLPRSAPVPAHGWDAQVQLALTPKHLQRFVMHSALAFRSGSWAVVSHLDAGFQLKEPQAQWRREWGGSWQDPLPYGGPVTVSGSFGIDSTLTVGQNDGIHGTPAGATLKPGKSGSVKTTFCGKCTGYTMPLHGVETLHLLYTQGGHELQRIDVQATLDVRTVLNG